MITGIVNEDLVPIVPVRIKDKDGEWRDISLLLDTGFNGDIVLEATLLDRYNLATLPDHQFLTPDDILESHSNWRPNAPYTGELHLQGRPRQVGIRPVREHPLNGMLGTEPLKYCYLTLEIVVGGIVIVENGSPPPESAQRHKRQRASATDLEDYLVLEDYLTRYGPNLPWAKLQVYDSKGDPKSIWANVDTGNNQELSLPSDRVSSLGLRATGKGRTHTTDGLAEADKGEAEIFWEGRKRTVEWTGVPGDKPPTIGTRLLKGKRITMYFDFSRPTADIRDIPSPPGSIRRFLNGLRDALHS